MLEKQKSVFSGIVIAAIISCLCTAIPLFTSSIIVVDQSMQSLLKLWFQVSIVVVFWLFVTIAMLARHRFYTVEDIDAAANISMSDKARALQAIVQNTLEQSVLAIIVYGAWIFIAPQNWNILPIIFAGLFSVGRLLFIACYKYGAGARSFGFALTFIPSIILMVALLAMQIF